MPETSPSTLRLLLAFAAIYVIWGSTYLAILFAIETLPPFLMAGVRFLIAGGLVYAWARVFGGAPRPAAVQWRAAALLGLLLLVGGNGLVVWSETRVPSGVAALLVAIVPGWMVLLDWLRPGGVRPARTIVLGLLLGLSGVAWLIGPEALLGGGRVDLLGAGALLVASFSWSAGSILSRQVALPKAQFLSTAMQMLAGGVALTLLGIGLGEPWRFDAAAVTLKSVLALAYLVVFGSIIGFTAYVWLLRVSTPARVSTYAYVNPVVAVLLGWALAGEALTSRMVVAASVIVLGVVLITVAPKAGPHVAVAGEAAAGGPPPVPRRWRLRRARALS
jgi:drug/metabolite transporter (DMT)-like permease